MGRRLPARFFKAPTEKVARDLLGKILCVRTRAGVSRSRIVETEAYLGAKDQACHSYRNRKTDRNKAMYLRGGHGYVYFVYGMHFCFNVVTRDAGMPEAVLIRAVEPLDDEGVEPMTNGPGKLCRHLRIDRRHDGLSLTRRDSPIWLEEPKAREIKKETIHRGPRVGIDGAPEAKDWPLRFLYEGNRYVSKKPRPRSM